MKTPGGGGGTPLYKPYRYVPPQDRVFAASGFGLKTGIDFAYFGLEFGYGFRGNYGIAVYERIYHFTSK